MGPWFRLLAKLERLLDERPIKGILKDGGLKKTLLDLEKCFFIFIFIA